MGRPRVVVVGSINADLSLTVPRHPEPGETLHGRGGDHAPGGKGANQALAAALWGADATMIGAVGSDANATPATALLRAHGVDLQPVATVPGPTGLAVITVDAAGENTIIVIPGANAQVRPAMVERHARLISAADVVICQCEIPIDTVAATAAAARGRFILNLAPVTPVPLEVLRRCDPLVVNEHEARGLLTQLHGAQAGADDDPAAGGARPGHEQVARAIRSHGIGALVITLGAQGAVVADGQGITPVASMAVDVVDTTGAGDAFVGTLGAALAGGADLRSATAAACRAGALATTAPGAQSSYPTTLAPARR